MFRCDCSRFQWNSTMRDNETRVRSFLNLPFESFTQFRNDIGRLIDQLAQIVFVNRAVRFSHQLQCSFVGFLCNEKGFQFTSSHFNPPQTIPFSSNINSATLFDHSWLIALKKPGMLLFHKWLKTVQIFSNSAFDCLALRGIRFHRNLALHL